MKNKLKKRPSPKAIEEFIKGADIDQANPSPQTVSSEMPDFRPVWPIDRRNPNPQFAEGSILRKPLTINLRENEWNTIEEHIQNLGVRKTDWLRHALFKLIEEEQKYIAKMKIK